MIPDLSALDKTDESAVTDALSEFDDRGLFIAPGESFERFAERMALLREKLSGVPGDPDLLSLIADAVPLSAGTRTGAETLTEQHFRFRADWVPAWYSTRRTGHFSAGIQYEIDDVLPLIFLHGSFRRSSRVRGYSLPETLAHEMVHAARIAFPESSYEEYFPCCVHASSFRRTAGNLFRKWYLPVLFFGGLTAVPLLFLANAPLEYAFLFLLPPAGIAVREILLRRRLVRAWTCLERLGYDASALLPRLSDREIYELPGMDREDLRKKAKLSARWRMLLKKFART